LALLHLVHGHNESAKFFGSEVLDFVDQQGDGNAAILGGLGNCDEELYFGDFSHYAREQFRRLKLSYTGSDESLNSFQQDPTRALLVDKMISTGLVRDSLSRPLEVAILIDRVLWLEERGYKAELIEVFDAKQSPRNIALIATPA
jgi:hypothetical protein